MITARTRLSRKNFGWTSDGLQIALRLVVAGFFRVFREMMISTKLRCAPRPRKSQLPVDSFPALPQHPARMSASEKKLSFTRAALKAAACQPPLFVSQSLVRDLAAAAMFRWRAARAPRTLSFEEDCYV
jgi:hypothetical protein